MALTEFAPHGECRVGIEGRLLVTRVSGPWNLELVEQWAAGVLPAARLLGAQGPWAALGIVSQSMLSTPEAVAVLGKSIRRVLAEGRPLASVYAIAPGVEGRGLMNGGLERMHHGMVPVRFFDTETDARAWLTEQLGQS